MPHPFFESKAFPWSRADAQALLKSLTDAISDPRDISFRYLTAGENLPPLPPGNAEQVWRDALHNLCLARRLERFFELLIADRNLEAIHDDVRKIIEAQPEDTDGEPDHRVREKTTNVARNSDDVVRVSRATAQKRQRESETPDEAFSRLAEDARDKFSETAATVLRSDATRNFIQAHNRLENMSANSLAKEMVSSNKPMLFLFRCVARTLPVEHSHEVASAICQLVEIIAPLCLSAEGLEKLSEHLHGDAEVAAVGTCYRRVAASLVGLIKGLPITIADAEIWDEIRHDHLPALNRVASLPHPPELGAGMSDSPSTKGIVEVFGEGLELYLAPFSSDIGSVQAALTNLAEELKVHVCVLFREAIASTDLVKLHETFPELILMVSTSTSESRQNNLVLDQIKKITDFFGPLATNGTK